MPQKAPRIPDQTWNHHKETIIPFYQTTSLPETIKYMAEQHGFRATKNQYTDKLKKWGVQKYHPGNDWAVIHSTKRKRSEQGKESDVYIRERKYTRKEQEKEIARHVPLGREWCHSEDALPDYITVCTPKGEVVGIHRKFLLRDLPWYHFIQQMQAHVSGTLQANMALSTPGTFLERAIANLDPQWEASLPPLTVGFGFFGDTKNSLSAYLPPEDRDMSRLPTEQSTRLRKESPLSVFQMFLKHVIFLSANNILSQGQFDKVYDWILEKGGENILVFLCQLRPPLNEVLAKKVLYSASSSGNVALARKVLHCRIRLQPDNPSQRQFWTGCLAIAVNHGNRAMVELLCEARVRSEVDRNSWRDDWDLRLPILYTLLDFHADPERFITDEGAGFPLIDAALNGCVGAVELLLNKGSRVNLCLPEYYGTALQAAVSRGHSEVAEYLIQHGADTNIANIQQIQLDYWGPELPRCQRTSILTPVQIAAKINDVRLLQTLLQHGASATACPISACDGIVAYICNSVRKGRPLQKNHQCDMTKLFYTALQYGIINQNLEVVARLLSAGASPDARVAPGVDDTPLQMSARLGNAKIFQILWSWGACIHAPAVTYNGRTAMQGAAESGNWEIISMLLRAGAQINEPPGAKQGMTALQAACLNGHSMVAGVLFARGAQLNAHPSAVAGLTPLQAAAAHGDIGLVQDLIALGSDVNAPATEGGMTALFAAMEHNNLPLLELLAQHGADVNATADRELQSPLMIATSNNWFDGVRFLLKSSARVNDPLIVDDDDDYDPDYLFSPLGWAIRNDSEEMIDLLLQHGADVGAVADFNLGLGALMYALDYGSSFEVIDLLLRRLPILEEHPGWERVLEFILLRPLYDDTICRRRILDSVKSLPPLLRRKAAQRAWNELPNKMGYLGDLDYEEEHMRSNIGLLLEFGVSLDYRALNESTLLMRTVLHGYERSCSYLISRGATINARAANRWGTPLQEAIKESNINIASILLDHGADINAFPAEIRGVTALQAASINGLFELAIQLLERGADVAAPAAPKDGRTAIDGAAERGHIDMVKLLLNAYPEDADMKAIRYQAARYAEKEGHIDLAEWLREG